MPQPTEHEPLESSTQLYRILGFERLVEVFETGELHLSHPSTWEDPYETALTHRISKSLFATCWCKNPVSDAMWRIYSKNDLSVRMSTTVGKITAQIDTSQKRATFAYLLDDVAYESQATITLRLNQIKTRLEARFNPKTAARALLLKRRAFKHEDEVRIVAYARDRSSTHIPRDGYKIAVKPHELITGVLVDPRAPNQFVDAYRHYLNNVLGYKGAVKKSQLYAQRAPIEVQDDEEA